MALFDVVFDEGSYCALLPDGRRRPIRLGGEPVKQFQTGWSPVRVYAGLSPLYVLELRHADASWSVWYLDKEFNHLGTSVDTLGEAVRGGLLPAATALFDRMWVDVFCNPAIALSRPSADFLKLCLVFRKSLYAFVRTVSGPAMHLTNAEDPGQALAALGLDPANTRALLDFDHQEHVTGFATAGRVTYPSPFDGDRLNTSHCIVLDSFRFVYRFHDPVFDRVFFAALTGHVSAIHGLVVTAPGQCTVVCRDETYSKAFTRIMSGDIRHDLMEHLCTVGSALPAYLAAKPSGMANVQRRESRHMGHQLWNELTGLMRLVSDVPTHRLPLTIVLNPDDAGEIYGLVDTLFPEFAGKVIRHLNNSYNLAVYLYSEQLCAIRVTSLRVTAELRRRIVGQLSARDDLAGERARYERLCAAGVPVFLLGLRVENRTVVDLQQFCAEIVTLLMRRYGRVAIVVDGHNQRNQTSDAHLDSNWAHLSVVRPVDVERSILGFLQTRFPDDMVEIIDMVGKPMATNLFWIDKSVMFIAPWGTGMAKYCWICDKPGYVLATDWNRAHRGDIGIYEEPYSEAPQPIYYASSAVIKPRPDSAVLVEVVDWPKPSYENFDIDYGLMKTELWEILDAVWSHDRQTGA